MRALIPILTAALASFPCAALAWGNEGHEIIAVIARDELTPQARAWVDHLLAEDTGPDMLSQATWADAWVAAGHEETAQWHFVDIELDSPDLAAACHALPKTPAPASAGPAEDCIVDKLNAFEEELADPSTSEPERILALKYVLNLVGDIHQPLNAADNHDRRGECVTVSLAGHRRLTLHAYWESAVLAPLGPDPVAAAHVLEAHITRAQKASWAKGSAGDWAEESYGLARSVAYTIGSPPGCGAKAAPIALRPTYQTRAEAVARIRLEKAGVRLAAVLNRSAASAVAR
jgi:S1/P1 Nuclease